MYVNTEDRGAFKELTRDNTHAEIVLGTRTRFNIMLSDEDLTMVKLSFTEVNVIENEHGTLFL